MKLIYIAGPYRGKTVNEIYWNVQHAREMAESVLRLCPGWFPIVPHLNTAFMDGLVDDKIFLKGDKEILKRCDGILLSTYWKDSRGAVAEHRFALKNKIPVFSTLSKLKEAK